MKAYIKAISYYLPQTVLSNEELAVDFPEWSVDKIASKIGISQRHIAATGETAADMAIHAAERLFEENPSFKREDVDFVLLCTQSPDYFLPTSACVIQHKLGLSTACGALDYNLGCSGYIYGLSLAKGLIFAGIARNVLLLTAETYTKYLHPRDKGNRTIFGDAATATIVSTDGLAEIGNFNLGTDGAGADNLIVRTGGWRHPMHTGHLTFDENGNPIADDYLYMNGSEIFNFTLDAVPALIEKTLIANGLKQEEVDLFIFHQANRYILDFLRKKLHIAKEKFCYCMENTGNTVSSTIPIALHDSQCMTGFRGHVLLAGFGVGYSWGGTILTFKES